MLLYSFIVSCIVLPVVTDLQKLLCKDTVPCTRITCIFYLFPISHVAGVGWQSFVGLKL